MNAKAEIEFAYEIVKDDDGKELFDVIDYITVESDADSIYIETSRKITELVKEGRMITDIHYTINGQEVA